VSGIEQLGREDPLHSRDSVMPEFDLLDDPDFRSEKAAATIASIDRVRFDLARFGRQVRLAFRAR
jgi:hypothetical protein